MEPHKETHQVRVTATVGYEDKGTRRYMQTNYSAEHWEEAMATLFATNDWIKLQDRLWKDGIPQIYGITFNFKKKVYGLESHYDGK